MKNLKKKLIRLLFTFSLCFSLSLLFAQKQPQKLFIPEKQVGFFPIDNFVTQCFLLYDKVFTIIETVQLLSTQTGSIDSVILQANDALVALKAVQPSADSLVSSATVMFDYAKTLPLLKIPRAYKNLKSALEAGKYCLAQIPIMVTTTIPNLKQQLLPTTTSSKPDTLGISKN